MKTMLISATLTIFLFGTAFAREVVISRVVTPHGASISRTSHSAIKQRERRPMRDAVYHDDKQRREEDHS
jgi:hypothetical protein